MPSSKIAVVIQGRLNSTRLPGKLMMDICGKTAIEHLYRRMRQVRRYAGRDVNVLVATPSDDAWKVFESTGIMAVGGPEKDVLTRILNAAHQVEADLVVRVTADNVLTCPEMVAAMLKVHEAANDVPMTTNWLVRSYPNGSDLEVYDVKYLEFMSQELKDECDREWFAAWAVAHLPQEATHTMLSTNDLSYIRLTLDYPEDLELIRKIYAAMGDEIWTMSHIVGWLQQRPHLLKINDKYNKDFGARPK